VCHLAVVWSSARSTMAQSAGSSMFRP
jgi:hypothetical protein